MLDNINNGFQSLLSGHNEKAGKFEKFADGVLWLPRKMWQNKKVEHLDNSPVVYETKSGTNLLERRLKDEKSGFIGNTLSIGLYAVGSLISSPFLPAGGLMKGAVLLCSKNARTYTKGVQQDIKFTQLQTKYRQLDKQLGDKITGYAIFDRSNINNSDSVYREKYEPYIKEKINEVIGNEVTIRSQHLKEIGNKLPEVTIREGDDNYNDDNDISVSSGNLGMIKHSIESHKQEFIDLAREQDALVKQMEAIKTSRKTATMAQSTMGGSHPPPA